MDLTSLTPFLRLNVQSLTGDSNDPFLVVKNSPFPVFISLSSETFQSRVSFSSFSIQASLVYDTLEKEERSVLLHKGKPFSFKLVEQKGSTARMECKIHVLSSQHENLAFRIKFCLVDPISGKQFDTPLQSFSDPIRVVSKPEQLRKRKAPVPVTPVKKTKTELDGFVEQLNSLDRLQQEQLEIHSSIEQALSLYKPTKKTENKNLKLESPSVVDFEEAFENFHQKSIVLEVTNKVSLLEHLTPSEQLTLGELFDIFQTESFQQEYSFNELGFLEPQITY